jgi:hydroxypyruvate reductase
MPEVPLAPAILCWGKAAPAFYPSVWKALSVLVISPSAPKKKQKLKAGHRWIRGEHPIPGSGSLHAGKELVRFFRSLEATGTKRLDVFLSGGSSSTAWLPFAGMRREALLRELKALYRKPLTIREMNRRRSKLCQLKAGGASRLARQASPKLKIRVFCISDVEPYGLEVLGSGPFCDGETPHRVLADNARLRNSLAKKLRACDEGFVAGSIERVCSTISRKIRTALRESSHMPLENKRDPSFIWGCEPLLALSKKAGRGGRQSHLAAMLLRDLARPISEGRLEILCTATDGKDGSAGASGVFLDRKIFSKGRSGKTVAHREENLQKRVTQSLKRFDSASFLDSIGTLLPAYEPWTNVQDVVVVRIRSGKSMVPQRSGSKNKIPEGNDSCRSCVEMVLGALKVETKTAETRKSPP